MKLIKKVVISRFRSIDNKTIETDDITIFSGVNNSGKSNILRALNLFFNGETSTNQKYKHDTDYHKAFGGSHRGKREVKITVYFEPYGNGALNREFWITKTFSYNDVSTEYHSSDPATEDKIKEDGNIRRQYTTFLNKIHFIYIPAVRDKKFVHWLFLQFEELIKQDATQANGFSEAFSKLSDILRIKSEEVSEEFERFIKLPTRASLSSQYSDILGAVAVNVGTKFSVSVSRVTKERRGAEIDLFSAGDGVLMSYVAFFIAHISKKITKNYFIWGFEEPENSLEYSKIQSLAENFYNNFREKAQIFVTTHSPAFINLKDRESVQFYRVYLSGNDNNMSSEIKTLSELQQLAQQTLFDENISEYEKLCRELHLVEQAQEIESAVYDLCREQERVIEQKKNYKLSMDELKSLKPQKIFIYEDGNAKTGKLWKALFEKYGIDGVCCKSSSGCENYDIETYINVICKEDKSYKPKIFREMDRDGLTDEQIEFIYENQELFFKKIDSGYLVRFLPVGEIENFAVLAKPDIFDDKLLEKVNCLEVAFDLTAVEKTSCLVKKIPNIKDEEKKKKAEDLFGSFQNKSTRAVCGMRQFARKNPFRFFPGKDIGKIVSDFNTEKILLDAISRDELPSELDSFMSEIKAFFEEEC